MTSLERAPRARVFSWALYDFASTIFSMNMLSMYFPLWVTGEMHGRDIDYSICLSVSVIAAGLSMPLIGSLSDRLRRRVPFLLVLASISCACTAAIGYSGGLLPALALFALANYGYQTALVPYDALLPEVSRGFSMGKVSGLGVGLGYLGSISGLLLVKPFVDGHSRSAAFLPTAVLFMLFSLPAFIFIKESPGRRPKSRLDIGREFRKILLTLRNTRRYPGLLRFLIANIIYSDAINTVIVFMAVYASKVIGMNDAQIRTFLIASTVFAAAGSWLAGQLTHRFGPKRTLLGVLSLWLITLMTAGLSQGVGVFWLVGPLAGISLGGTWVSSRTLVAELAPPGKLGQAYGLYNLGGKFGFVAGPLVWGGIVLAFERYGIIRYRFAIFSLVLFLAASILVLVKVPPRAMPEGYKSM